MSHHVGIRVIHDDGVEFALPDGFYNCLGNSRRGHFRLQIVGRHFRRRHQNPFFASERFLHATVEKIGYVCVLFRLCSPQVLVLQLGKDLGQDVFQFFRRNHELQPRPVLVVLRHPNVKQILRPVRIHKLVKVRRRQGVSHLAGAIRAKIKENHRIIVVDCPYWSSRGGASLRNYNRLDEFIGDVRFIAPL